MDISHPHDSFFRYMISKTDRAIDIARYQIPSHIAKYFLFDTMTSEPDTFVDSQLKNRYSDALFKVLSTFGSQAYVYMLIDHKSSPDAGVIFQLQRYINQFWERHTINHKNSLLPPIIGIVIYHGISPWNIETDMKNQFDCPEDLFPYMPVFRYHLIDLSNMSDDQLRGKADLRAALLMMKYIYHPNLRDYVPMILRVLKKARHQPDFLAFFEAFLLYLFNGLNKEHHKELEKIVRIEFPEEGEQAMPTIADMFREQGREEGLEQGLEQGIEQGIEEGRKRLFKGIIKLTQTKFGHLPLAIEKKITSVQDLSTLETIMDLAIDSETLVQFQQQMESILSQ